MPLWFYAILCGTQALASLAVYVIMDSKYVNRPTSSFPRKKIRDLHIKKPCSCSYFIICIENLLAHQLTIYNEFTTIGYETLL